MTSDNESRENWKIESDFPKIIILGGGYVATYLHEHLNRVGFNADMWKSSQYNYHDGSFLNKALWKSDPTFVINCSGFTGRPNVDEAEELKEECWNLNVVSPLQVNKICNRLEIRYLHISSGCIYNGYEKEYVEDDKPDFGLFDHSSFYSKSKHAFEIMSKDLTNKIIRIRMPITPDAHPRSYLTKILKYDNLINYKNSKTYIPDLCNFVENLVKVNGIGFWRGQDIYNVVNPEPLTTGHVIEYMKLYGKCNPNWKMVDMNDIDIKAPRSNCVLNGAKADAIYQMRTEREILTETLITL